ncbi:MAG: hypothetical protein IPJ65_31475 [Archangiaceae bacterium]|nr:hypothetical protein [Archangiaceae bacterium]
MTRLRPLAVAAVVLGATALLWFWPSAAERVVTPSARVLTAGSPESAGSKRRVPPHLAAAPVDAGEGEVEAADEETDDAAWGVLRIRVEQNRRAVMHAEVVAMRPGHGPEWDETFTGEDGEAELEVYAGFTEVFARKGDLGGRALVEVAADRPNEVVVELADEATVEGRVTDQDGKAIADAQVTGEGRFTLTAADGTYQLVVRAEVGSVRTHVEDYMIATRSIAPRPGQHLRVDFVLQRAVGFTLDGECDGAEVEPLFSTLLYLDGGRAPAFNRSEVDGGQRTFAVPGSYRYQLTGPAHGYRCELTAPFTASEGAHGHFVLRRTERPWGDTEVPDASTRTGTLVLSSRPLVATPATLHRARPVVLLTGPGGTRQSGALPWRTELEPGRWHVRALTVAGSAEVDVDVTEGAVSEVVLQLVPRGFQVSGRLVDPRTGAAPENLDSAYVSIFYPSETGGPYFTADLDVDGQFVFREVLAGRAVVAVQLDGFARLLRPLTLNGSVELGAVQLTPGESGVVDLTALEVTTRDSPAGLRVEKGGAALGLEPGDVITAFSGVPLKGLEPDDRAMASVGPLGEPCAATVERRGRELTVKLPRAPVP